MVLKLFGLYGLNKIKWLKDLKIIILVENIFIDLS